MYVLHFWPDSASLIVRLVLEELGLPYQARLIDREGGELESPAYRALNPLGKIPALETPEGAMFETAAILTYLAERHGALAPQPGDPDRGAFLKWLFFTSFNLHVPLLSVFYADRIAGPDCAGAVAAQAGVDVHRALAILDDMVAREAPGFLSTAPSVLGYYLAVQMRWLAQVPSDQPGYVDSTDYPALHAILAALEKRPAALRAARAETLGKTIFTNPV